MRISSTIKEDELDLEIEFKLLPSRNAFSKVRSELWFDERKASSVSLDIRSSFGSTDEFQFNPVLNLQGISAGVHSVRVEMFELSSSGEKRFCSVKDATIEYLPQTKQANLREIPLVKRIESQSVAVVSESEKDIYREIEEAEKRELASQRDGW